MIKSAGTIVLQGQTGVITTGNAVTPVTLQSFGGSVFLVAFTNNVQLGDQTTIRADGGNVSITALGNVVGGTTTAGGPPGNTIVARALVSGSSFQGGGVQIQSGTTNSTINNTVINRPNPITVALNMQNVTQTWTGTKGKIVVGPVSQVILNNSAGNPNPLALGGLNPVIIIQGSATTTVQLDSASIFSVTPTSNIEVSTPDEVIVDTGSDSPEDNL
jgi:hypothetical protein